MRNDSVRFNEELKYDLAREKIPSCAKFDEIFLEILNKHTPLKSKLLCANHASYRSYHENLYFKKRTDHYFRNYKNKKLLQQTIQKREK